MGQGRGELGREWRERVLAHGEQERTKKQARIDRQNAVEDRRLDQVSCREVPYAI